MKISSLTERAKLSALILMKIASGEFNARRAKTMAVDSVDIKNGDAHAHR